MVDLSQLSFGFGLVVTLGYVVGVGAGSVLALAALVPERWVKPVSGATAHVAVVPALGIVVLAASVGRLEDPLGSVPGALGLAVTLALLWGVPLLVGRALLVRYADLSPGGRCTTRCSACRSISSRVSSSSSPPGASPGGTSCFSTGRPPSSRGSFS